VKQGTRAPRAASRAGALLRLFLAISLVGYLFWRADPQAVARAFSGTRWTPLLIVVSLVLVDRALMAFRWFALLRPLEGRPLPPFSVIVRVFFVSTFVGTFLPGSIGGDAVRAYSLSTHGVPISDATASVFVDRMLGVLALFIMAVLGLWLAFDLASDTAVLFGLGLTGIACAIAGVLVFSEASGALAETLLARLPWERARRVFAEILGSIRRYADYRHALTIVLAASVGVQVLRVFQAYFLGVALGIGQPLLTYFAFVPLILLVMLLPITVNGIGTSQAAFIWFFGRMQTPAHEAFALSVLFVALQVVGNIPGAIFVIADTFPSMGSRHRAQ
jgi:uncharacterized protein (TIRG00374 family)